MRRKLMVIVTAMALLLGVAAAPAGARGYPKIATPKVMTLNMYVGAEIGRLLEGEPPAAILETIEETNIVERAQAMAAEIDRRNPDLIGLQEVSLITLFTLNDQGGVGEVLQQADYLDILLRSLAARGEKYEAVSQVKNADVTLPIEPGVFGNLTDRDVILARVETTKTENAASGNYAVNFQVPFGGTIIEFTRGWTSVNAKVRDAKFTFVNTHLEVEPDPTTGEGFCVIEIGPVPCQIPQAQELVKVLASSDHPTILVGDFNAVPGTDAYNIIAGAGFVDAWDVRLFNIDQQENTCCQLENLMNEKSQLSQRIDIVFVRVDGWVRSLATVVFDRPWEKTPSGLWPSDHGAVVARLLYPL